MGKVKAGKDNSARGGTTRGGSLTRGKPRGGMSGRGVVSTSKSSLAARDGVSPVRITTGARVGGASPSKITTRGGPTNRGKGKDSLHRTGEEKTSSRKRSEKKDASISDVPWPMIPSDGEKKVYKVTLSNAVFMKLMTANAKGAHMKINISDKMEIDTGESKKIQLNLSRYKKGEMAFVGHENSVGFVGKVVGHAKNTAESHITVKSERATKKLLKASYEKASKEKRKVQVLEYDELPSEEVKAKSKRQKNNTGPSIKVQPIPSPPIHVSSNRTASQPSNDTKVARGGKTVRGKARGGRTRTVTEVADDDVFEATVSTSIRGSNTIRGGKTTRGGKSTRGRSAKTLAPDIQKSTAPPAQSTTSTRGKRGRPAGVPNKTTRGAKTYTNTMTRASVATKPAVPSVIVKNENEQQSMSEGTNSSSSKKGKRESKTKMQSAPSSEWKPGQMIKTLTEFKQARKFCENLENDIQNIFDELGTYEIYYNNYISSIEKGLVQETLLKEIERQFGEGTDANKLMHKYSQLEKDIEEIYDELWRAANDGVYED